MRGQRVGSGSGYEIWSRAFINGLRLGFCQIGIVRGRRRKTRKTIRRENKIILLE